MSDQAVVTVDLPAAAQAELATAVARLQAGGGILVRLADLLGGIMGRSMRLGARSFGMAPAFETRMRGLATVALRQAFDVAVIAMGKPVVPTPDVTRSVVMISGAVGGFLGLGGLLPDVTVTTLAIMRSIARIAQEAGEDLNDEEARRACLEVLALTAGGEGQPESGYFSARLMMQGRPMVLLLSEVAGRYGVSLSQKFALQAVPFVGAVSGAALNAAFLRHYQEIAQAHFAVRRLERSFGSAAVQKAWPSSQHA